MMRTSMRGNFTDEEWVNLQNLREETSTAVTKTTEATDDTCVFVCFPSCYGKSFANTLRYHSSGSCSQ